MKEFEAIKIAVDAAYSAYLFREHRGEYITPEEAYNLTIKNWEKRNARFANALPLSLLPTTPPLAFLMLYDSMVNKAGAIKALDKYHKTLEEALETNYYTPQPAEEAQSNPLD